MPEWLQSIAGPDYASALLWTIGALVLLVVVLVIIRLVRGLTFGTFVAGGRNRKTRLAVMDATAVDSHRRLVLVRRDDVEHLILIGGPTDVVVEQNIRLSQPRRPALSSESQPEAAARPQRPVEQQRPVQPRPAPAAAPAAPATAPTPQKEPQATFRAPEPSYAAPAQRTVPQPTAPSAPRAIPVATDHAPPPVMTHDIQRQREPQAPVPTQNNVSDEIDQALIKELTTQFDHAPARPGAKDSTSGSLEDEMNKLLGELSSHKR